MPKLASQVVKARSRALTALHESYAPHAALVGTTLRAWFTETAADGVQLAGRSKGGVQVLAPPQPGLLGGSALLRVTAAGRWSVTGEVMQLLPRSDGAPAAPVLAQEAASGCGVDACCGAADDACCAAAASTDACCGSSGAPSAPATPAAESPRRAASAAAPAAAVPLPAAPAAAAAKLPAATPLARADWGEELLWAGVLLALSGVFAAGVLHLVQQAR